MASPTTRTTRRVVVDSSVFFAAAYSITGSAHELLQAAIQGRVSLFTAAAFNLFTRMADAFGIVPPPEMAAALGLQGDGRGRSRAASRRPAAAEQPNPGARARERPASGDRSTRGSGAALPAAPESPLRGPPKPRRLGDPVAVSPEDLVPADHFYRHLEAKLDLGFIREWARVLYAADLSPSRRHVAGWRCASSRRCGTSEGSRGVMAHRRPGPRRRRRERGRGARPPLSG